MEAGALHAPAGLSRVSIATPLLRLRSDEQLVAAFRGGNEEAFQVIFDRYRQRMFAYARQMLGGSRQDAEDAVQDVFLRAYAALRASDRPVSLRAWLYRVAHNRCIDQLRRPAPAQSDVFDLSRTPLRDPLEESQRREDLRRLVEDVQRLPEAQRSALLMREMDGLSYQELADALDVTVPAIKSLLVRARIGLVEAVEARDTACAEIRTDLMASYDKGVRASGKARRHLRDCAPCRAYRTELRTVQRGLGALSPGDSGPLGLLAKLFGLGGGAGGAAAGGSAVLGGGGAAVVGGGAATVTACKVAAIVCSAAFVTGAAGDLERAVKRAVQPVARSAKVAPAAATAPASLGPAEAPTLTRSSLAHLTLRAGAAPAAAAGAATAEAHRKHARSEDLPASAAVAAAEDEARPITPDDEVYDPPADPAAPAAAPKADVNLTGGAKAPAEDPANATVPVAPGATATQPAAGPTTAAPATTAPATTAPPTTGTTGATATTPSASAPSTPPTGTGGTTSSPPAPAASAPALAPAPAPAAPAP